MSLRGFLAGAGGSQGMGKAPVSLYGGGDQSPEKTEGLLKVKETDLP